MFQGEAFCAGLHLMDAPGGFCVPDLDLCQHQFLHACSLPDLFALSDCN